MPTKPADLLKTLDQMYHPQLSTYQSVLLGGMQDLPLGDFIAFLTATDRRLKNSFSYLINPSDYKYHFLSPNVEKVVGFDAD